MNNSMEQRQATDRLIALVRERGYFRVASAAKRKKRKLKYKRGWETRIPAEDKAEAQTIQQIIRDAGFKPGRPFQKHNQFIVPLYGKEPTLRLQEIVSGKSGC